MIQLNRKGGESILRIDVHRRITEKSQVKAIMIPIHSSSSLEGEAHL
jgi:hypothetical protein